MVERVGAALRTGARVVWIAPSAGSVRRRRLQLVELCGAIDPKVVDTWGGWAQRLVGAGASAVAGECERDVALARSLAEAGGVEGSLALTYRGFRRALWGVFDELDRSGLPVSSLEASLRRARLPAARVERLVEAYHAVGERLAGWGSCTGGALLGQARRGVECVHRARPPR